MLWCAATLRSSHAAAAWLWAANLPAASSTAPLPPCAAHPTHTPYVQAHALKNRNASRTTRLRRVSNASRRRIMMTGGWVGGFLGVPGMQGSCAAAAGQAGMHACSRGGHKSLTPPPPLVARRPPVAPPAGTPLQNDLAELQNLLHFLLPSVFAAQGFEDLAEMLQVGWAGGGAEGEGAAIWLLLSLGSSRHGCTATLWAPRASLTPLPCCVCVGGRATTAR